ncbi:MAG: hypothetical protein NW200_02770 [Hyphomonadaceae bacterium]|nr:hypothetical protein [Hyphomonadaceae bacterium]
MADAGVPVTADDIAARIAQRAAGSPLIVGLTGSVAAGKSTLCGALSAALAQRPLQVETVSTDGFLLPNDVLAARGLTLRKGFPESYDVDALNAALAGVRTGPATFPTYSHVTYDVDPAAARTLHAPDVLLVEGLALGVHDDAIDPAARMDALIYLDADEADLEAWFLARFMRLWRAAEHDPHSFYVRFRALSETGAEAFARDVWARINLVNLREHIAHARARATIVLRKDRDHALFLVRG